MEESEHASPLGFEGFEENSISFRVDSGVLVDGLKGKGLAHSCSVSVNTASEPIVFRMVTR